MNFFGVAPMKVIHISENGTVSYVDDMESEGGVTSISNLPKTEIMAAGMNEATCPKGNWKDSAQGFFIEQPEGTIDLAAMYRGHREASKWWDTYQPKQHSVLETYPNISI